MKEETVDRLLRAITDLAQACANNDLRFKALQNALQKRVPEIHQAYSDEVERLTKIGGGPINALFLSDLKAKLLQE